MKILLAHVCVTAGKLTETLAARFVGSYQLFPPGVEHSTVIVCNGGPLSREAGNLFLGLNKCQFFPRLNTAGWDIDAYLDVARTFPCDLLVCFGESVYFHRAGWLAKIVEAWKHHGPGMYGIFSSNLLRPHLQTTAFACAPGLFSAFPQPMLGRKERYEFEHGPRAFWRRVNALGRAVRLVTWDGDYAPADWRKPPNILWRGDQSNCLAWCNHTDAYNKAEPATRRKWAAGADQPFR